MSDAVTLRRVPYPYRAMLAIANDIDEATWEDFVLLHEYMNTPHETPLGRGLDLEIADSFFFYGTTSPDKKRTFTYFEGTDPERRSAHAGQMDLLMSSGHLDSLHSWGDFSRTGGFRRPLAVAAASALRSHGKVRVWINHGDARNEQKAGIAGWDDPAAAHGHADVAVESGLRYFWIGTLTSIAGQDAEDTWRDRARPARLMDDLVRPLRKTAARDLNFVRFFGNRLMKPARVCGRTIQVFQRYGFWDRPTACDLGTVVSPAALDQLERRGGFMAVYTHLFRRPSGMPLERVDWSPLVELAKRHRAGRIQVTTTSRLLEYAECRAGLQWTARMRQGETEIDVAAPPRIEQLQGLTFYVADARRARISVGGEPIPIERNPPDDTMRESVSVPWRPILFPREMHA